MPTDGLFEVPEPVHPDRARIEGVGVNPLDLRRVDVAVDVTPCLEPLTVEMVIVGPDDEELCSVVVLDSRDWWLDKILHLRRDAQAGEYYLHVGLFQGDLLLHHVSRQFVFPQSG